MPIPDSVPRSIDRMESSHVADAQTARISGMYEDAIVGALSPVPDPTTMVQGRLECRSLTGAPSPDPV
jgi:hypothetical protein